MTEREKSLREKNNDVVFFIQIVKEQRKQPLWKKTGDLIFLRKGFGVKIKLCFVTCRFP